MTSLNPNQLQKTPIYGWGFNIWISEGHSLQHPPPLQGTNMTSSVPSMFPTTSWWVSLKKKNVVTRGTRFTFVSPVGLFHNIWHFCRQRGVVCSLNKADSGPAGEAWEPVFPCWEGCVVGMQVWCLHVSCDAFLNKQIHLVVSHVTNI